MFYIKEFISLFFKNKLFLLVFLVEWNTYFEGRLIVGLIDWLLPRFHQISVNRRSHSRHLFKEFGLVGIFKYKMEDGMETTTTKSCSFCLHSVPKRNYCQLIYKLKKTIFLAIFLIFKSNQNHFDMDKWV